jgi:uncharacterized protein
MKTQAAAKLIRIHFGEGDKWEGQPLVEAIVEKCRDLGIAGAIVVRGSEGYGAGTLLQRRHLFSLSPNSPLTIQVIDSDEKIRQLLPELERMVDEGLIVICDVETTRYSRGI